MNHLKQFGAFWCLLALMAGFVVEGQARQKVIDGVGRTIDVPPTPRRIVAFSPSTTEIIYALGQQHRLVGVTRFSDFPSPARKLPKIGSYVHLDLERIVALKPDLCIGIRDGNPKSVVDRLTSMDIPVFVADPRNLQSVMGTISSIGGLLQAQTQARAIVAEMQQTVDFVSQKLNGVSHRPRVFFQIGIDPIISVGRDTFINELIERAGGENVAAGPTAYPRFSREQVIAKAPDIMIISSMARGIIFDQVKAEWQRWPSIPAVTANAIVLERSNLFDRPSPRLAKALLRLAQHIHPERFAGPSP